MSGKARFGRPVLSARLNKDTKFDVTKRSIQTNLVSRDAAGNAAYRLALQAREQHVDRVGEEEEAEDEEWAP